MTAPDQRTRQLLWDALTAIANVLTDDQLDRPIPKLHGKTARQLYSETNRHLQETAPIAYPSHPEWDGTHL